MPVTVEMLNKGLVTARDPALLRPGELQRANDCIYRPNDQAIWKAPGRAKYNDNVTSPINTNATTVKGQRYLQFDDLDTLTTVDYLIAYEGTNYWWSAVPAATDPPTGTFLNPAAMQNVGDGPTLDAVHYNGRHYLLNGNNDIVPNQVFKPPLTTGGVPVVRRHGLKAVTEVPVVASQAGAGWPAADAGFGVGYYFFITTEVVDPGGADEVESTWAGKATSFDSTQATKYGVINITDLANGVLVTKPPTVNTTATHWRIYLHGPETTDNWNDSFLLTSFLVATVPIGTTTKIVGNSESSQGFKLPTTVFSSGTWTNPSGILTKGVGAATTSSTDGDAIVVGDFSFTTIGGGTVFGIEVMAVMNTRVPSHARVLAYLSDDGGSNWRGPRILQNVTQAVEWLTAGGPTDDWGVVWTDTKLNNTNFRVKLEYDLISPLSFNDTIYIDYTQVKIDYGTGAVLSKAGPLFPATSIQIGNIVTTFGSNGEPPVASTGDIYEGQLVTNDVTKPSFIRYSMPDGVDYFPFPYFISFETKEKDVVTLVRRLGDKLIVGLKHQVYRANYLPRAEDSEFDRGRCYEAIAEDHGIIGTQAACLFSPPDKPQLLAYVSSNGIHATDGFTTTTLTEDLDWQNMVHVPDLYKCVLVNYSHLSALVLYYVPKPALLESADATPTRALWFNYHPSHVKEGGKLLVCGPVKVTAPSATVGKHAGRSLSLTGNVNGTIYVEDPIVGSGFEFTDDSGTGIFPDIVTRDLYSAGIGYEYTVERMWIRHYQHVPWATVVVTPYWKNTEAEYLTPPAAGGDQWTPKSFITGRGGPVPGSAPGLINSGGLSRIDVHLEAESFAWRFTDANSNAGMALSWMATEHQGHGLEEKRG